MSLGADCLCMSFSNNERSEKNIAARGLIMHEGRMQLM